MLTPFHKQITKQALQAHFSEQALSEIILANLQQDLPQGQFGHPEYHFDDSEFTRTNNYMDVLRLESIAAIQQDNPELSRSAFGKLTHAAQDFYAHSNYIRLWEEQYQEGENGPGEHDFLIPELVNHPDLISGKFYQPWEWITFFPLLGKHFAKFFPEDSHAKLNLDTPDTGKLFQYAFDAAVFRTEYEYNELVKEINSIDPLLVVRFTGIKNR